MVASNQEGLMLLVIIDRDTLHNGLVDRNIGIDKGHLLYRIFHRFRRICILGGIFYQLDK